MIFFVKSKTGNQLKIYYCLRILDNKVFSKEDECATTDFITPDLWPPNSPDLNLVDYRMWGILQERVYRKSVKDVDELKLRLIEALVRHPAKRH